MDAANLLERFTDIYSKFNEGLSKRKGMCWDPGLDVVLHKTQYCEDCPTIVRILHTNQVSTPTSSVCQDITAKSNLQYLDLFCLPRYTRKIKPSRPMAALVLAMASNDQINDQSETSCLKVYWVVCNVHGCSIILYKRNLGPFFSSSTAQPLL